MDHVNFLIDRPSVVFSIYVSLVVFSAVCAVLLALDLLPDLQPALERNTTMKIKPSTVGTVVVWLAIFAAFIKIGGFVQPKILPPPIRAPIPVVDDQPLDKSDDVATPVGKVEPVKVELLVASPSDLPRPSVDPLDPPPPSSPSRNDCFIGPPDVGGPCNTNPLVVTAF